MKKKWFVIFGASVILSGLSAVTAGVIEDRASPFEDIETEAVVIDASTSQAQGLYDLSDADKDKLPTRSGRQYLSHYLVTNTHILPGVVTNVVSPFTTTKDTTCVTNQGKYGACDSFEKCYPLLNLPEETEGNATTNYNNLQEEVYQFSVDRKCASVVHAGASKFSNVCCDIRTHNADRGTEVPIAQFYDAPTPEEVLNQSPKYTKIVNQWANCGEKQFDRKIIGGEETLPHEYPWMVSLWGKSGKHICGASLLDNHYVLTAAHCVGKYTSEDVGKIRLLIGDHNIHSTRDGHHEMRSVSRVIKHKRFSFQTFTNDIALLKLDRPVAYSNGIRPICLPSGVKSVEADPMLVVAGWGQTVYKGTSSSSLRKVTVPGVSNEQCGVIYNGISPAGITSEMVCAGANGLDSCIGDSGGPLIQDVNGRYEQVGIVSFGRECGTYPGVYTRVNSYLNWITVNRNKY